LTSKSLLIWTVPFVLLAHYIAVFPHELTHSFVAWALGHKSNPLDIQYGGTSLSNLLLLTNVDENVNYQEIFKQNPYHVAFIAFAGPGIANGGLFLFSYWLLQKESIHVRPYFYYSILWFNLMNIANLFDYIPFRTFTPVNWDTDMSNLERGLNISPWAVYVVGGYLVLFVIWQFFSKTLVESYVYLGSTSLWSRCFLMISVVLVLFGYFSSAGLRGYGEISTFLSMTSRWICPAIVVFCWPDRRWVREKMTEIKDKFSSEQIPGARPVWSPETRVAPGLQPL
jgi:hypothetical protein